MFLYTETRFVPSLSLGIHLHGNVFCTEQFPTNDLHITIYTQQRSLIVSESYGIGELGFI
jgi:hypothetical protein